jgi:hypothetical protein
MKKSALERIVILAFLMKYCHHVDTDMHKSTLDTPQIAFEFFLLEKWEE